MYGLGASAPSCNFTDEFGFSTDNPNFYCGAAGSIAAFDIAADARDVLKGKQTFTQFVNKNATTLGILAAVTVGIVFISKR